MNDQYNKDLENMSIHSEDIDKKLDEQNNYVDPEMTDQNIITIGKFDYDHFYSSYMNTIDKGHAGEYVKFDNNTEWNKFDKDKVENSANNFIDVMKNIDKNRKQITYDIDINTLNQK